jgi:hypothetical protein
LIDETLMSYVHLHFGSNPGLADHLVRHVSARRRGHLARTIAVVPVEEGLRDE